MKLTVGYGRVSTEEQAAEGFSIEGQAEKLRTYAKLHDLGPLTFVEDPGLSGKDMNRPGLQQMLDQSDFARVGGATQTLSTRYPWEVWLVAA